MSNKKVTISDYIAQDRKDIPFEERAKRFEEELQKVVKEWGVVPSAVLDITPNGVYPAPAMRDLWQKDSSKK